ncbi:Piwi-domain-containing protein [Neolentinus lepideus HHB14362 ss-1]|uniref:Piwi-domain-containing protein n=1 Tax=Neolentinus lepideus HHB14362 ss-1 TaxID=1314782 RepID=A0A165MD60_9AGAM|nr:Piwi-domain-containing protein [Neolentinus lepideus HHB14362 ss-1]
MSNQGPRGQGGRGRGRCTGNPPRGGPSQGGHAPSGPPRGGAPQGGRGGPPRTGDGSDTGRGRGRGRGGGSSGQASPVASVAGDRGFGGQRRGVRGRGDRGSPAASSVGTRDGGPPGGTIFAANIPAVVDRQTNAAADQLVAAFKGLTISPDRPLRPGYGTLGKQITLRANFMPVKVPKGTMYDYTIAISPSIRGGEKRRLFDLIEAQPEYQAHQNYIAHDRGERLVSAKRLPDPLTMRIPYFEEGQPGPGQNAKVYTVEITYQRDLDMGQLTQNLEGDAVQRDLDLAPLLSALNIVLQQHPSHAGIRVGKNRYFFPSGRGIPIAQGVEAFQGFFTSVRPTYKQLMVNVNVAMTAFYIPGNLAEAMLEFQQNTRGGMPNSFARDVKITTMHLGYKRRYSIKGIGNSTARRTTFPCEELGGTVSVERFFKEKYNRVLRHADDLPVINVGARRPTWLPAEICDIVPGQPYGKLNDQETAQMIRYACQPPAVNANAIMSRGLGVLGHHPPQNPLNGFGISIVPEMTVIPGRELPAARVAYSSGAPRVSNGSWNILQSRFQKGTNLGTWWVLVVRDGPRDEFNGRNDPRLISFLQTFARKCQDAGLAVPSVPQIFSTPQLLSPHRDRNRTESLQMIQRAIQEKVDATHGKPSFILVLLSLRDNFIYPGIKRIGDVLLGVQTVHMLLSKALKDRGQDQYFSNVALKVNIKLGGMNHLLDRQDIGWLTSQKTMLVGMDVTHPGPKSIPGTPSIAAVVANVDDNFVQYPASLRPQESRTEMIQELQDMMIERLKLYEKRNRRLPDRVIVFRDGVSEGQYDLVNREELPQILEAFKKVRQSPAYRPKLTIAICGKRHHARFYPTDSQYADRNGNTRPGTVVDRGVTEVFGFDFYLQAHAGLQGTVKATHYVVIYDENKFQADVLQQGAHTQSYLYARATKAVSLIPPAYYADLACERGRFYINEFLNLGDDRASSTGGTRQDRDEARRRAFDDARRAWGEGLHPDVRETMFYI